MHLVLIHPRDIEILLDYAQRRVSQDIFQSIDVAPHICLGIDYLFIERFTNATDYLDWPFRAHLPCPSPPI